MSSIIKFAIVGCGHIGKRHAEMVLRNDEAELVALCDIKPKEELGLENFDAPFYQNLNDMRLIAKLTLRIACNAYTTNYSRT